MKFNQLSLFLPPKYNLMRNNNTERRSVTRGNGRRSSAAAGSGQKRAPQERPAGRTRYSAAEGSGRNSAEEGSVKRSYRKSSEDGFAKRSYRKPAEEGQTKRSYRKPGEASSSRGAYGKKRSADSFSKSETRPSGYRSNIAKGRFFAPKTTKAAKAPKSAEDGVRLNKFISNSGICSRREADEYITAGVVSVNDVIVTELGTKVFPDDVVKFNGERIKGEEKVYIVMNKPKDFVTTVSDPYAEKTVVGLVQGKCKARVYPVGRLDKATTGVLLLTNDGELADRLTHPSFEKKKIYHVHLDRNVKGTDMSELTRGIVLEDGPISVDEISYIDDDKSQVGVEIHSGRNRIIRRMFEHLGYKVKKLDRVYFAGLTKKNLRRGQWRFLTLQEVAMLKMGSFE